MRDRRQRAAEIIGPGMVGTDYAAGTMSGCAVEQPGSPMAAHIEERLDAVVASADHDQGLTEKIQGVIIAGIRDVIEVADDLPRRGEDLLLFGA